MDKLKIAYVEHPVSKEEKRNYTKNQGFDKVLDIKFAPAQLPAGSEVFKKKKSDKK